ncbi:hypothetical protein [Paucibacter sp. B51]|uniref:hypothetical protein n=1 Tax=Paucibacter sp. B51 TaxID=2993315 RepID=UPI0022EBD5F9|nr:hypothetical protein [Paucibacter sp. B51]
MTISPSRVIKSSAMESVASTSGQTQTASYFLVRCKDATLVPVFVVDEVGGPPRIVEEVVAFMQTLAIRGESAATLRGIANTLALLHDYIHLVQGSASVSPESLAAVVAGFLRRRRGLGADADNLSWLPVKVETVRRDRHYLSLFSTFCAETYGHWPLVPMRAKFPFDVSGQCFQSVSRELVRKSSMLLRHVAGTRDWAKFKPEIELQEKVVRRRSMGKTFMSAALIEDLVSSTPSIVQRMVFIQAAYGGPRISEILQEWRCDVLPGRYRPVLFPDDKASDVPLVVLAHPSQSRFVGDTRPGVTDRLQHLWLQYGLKPRPMLESEPLWAGWKGIAFDNEELLISQIFWADRGWARAYYDLFQQLRDRVLPLMPEALRGSHPYLAINDDPHRQEFGQPMKMSNIRKAFARACARIGADVSRFHEGVHGLRHFYKARLERLGLTPEEIRKAMHHVSVMSQGNYGQSSALLNERMSPALSQWSAS